MDWLYFALVSTASFAVTVIIDKLLLSRYVRSSTAYLITLLIIQQVFAALIFAFVGAGFTYPASVYAMLAGAAQAAMYVSYLRALKVEEASRVTSLIFVYPLFVFIAAAWLLGEVLTLRHYVGGILFVISAILVSYRPSDSGNMVLSPALRHIAFFWFFSAIYAIGIKYLLSFMDEWHLYIWTSIGTLLAVLPLLADQEMRAELSRLFAFRRSSFLVGAIIFEEIFDFLGRILSIFAFAFGPVALVSAVGALQPVITVVFVIALNTFLPGLLEEAIDRRTLTLKFLAGVLVILGVYLVT